VTVVSERPGPLVQWSGHRRGRDLADSESTWRLADGRRARKVNLEEKVGLLEGVHSPDIVGYLND
jgi:hypothetical protein